MITFEQWQACQRVLEDIATERDRQEERFGEQNHPDGTGGWYLGYRARAMRTMCDAATLAGCLKWRDVLLEEVYEALAESDPARLREELIQVAAVAAAWVEAIDRRAASNG